ncbi:MAG: hypothetical protein JW936_03240 [Sedimentisphaerales bacterium]|nr:hypothetical protein [Sedimentisphaerales bacterium]
MGELRLEKLLDGGSVKELLAGRGLSDTALESKTGLFVRAAECLAKNGVAADMPVVAMMVPGRIEVLGKHTDYAGGRTMITAVDKGFCLVAAGRSDRKMRVWASEWGQEEQFELSGDIEPRLGHWSNYPMTVARRVARNFPGELRGADIAFGSDLPPASGMSSSSAFLIAVFEAMSKINALAERAEYKENITDRESLAGYIATIENGQNFGTLVGDKGVGTFGGSEDHTAILCCEAKKLSVYSYCPVRFEQILDVPAGYVFAVASSGVVAEKTGAAMAKYNRASALARRCAEIWRENTGRDDLHIAAALASGADAGDELSAMLSASKDSEFDAKSLVARYEHFRAESDDIIPQAAAALAEGDLAQFGRMVDVSQALAETLLGTQVPATISLARTARELGAVAASAFGAGFGGSVWALVAEDKVEKMLKEWEAKHAEAFPELMQNAAFFVTQAGPAASTL